MGPVARLYAQIKLLERQESFLGRYGLRSEQDEINNTIERLEQDMQREYQVKQGIKFVMSLPVPSSGYVDETVTDVRRI